MSQKVFFFHSSFFTLVPQITYQEHVVEIPQVQTVERIRQVPKIVTQERIIEIPKIRTVENVIHVPKIVMQEVVREVPNIQVVEVIFDFLIFRKSWKFQKLLKLRMKLPETSISLKIAFFAVLYFFYLF